MRHLGKLAIAALILLSPTLAKAADPISVPLAGDTSLPVADAGFDWNGFYVGVYGAGRLSAVEGGQIGAGIDLGASARLELVLVGGEVALEGLTGSTATIYGEVVGRAGIMLTDDLVLYGATGLGSNFGGETDALFGGGVEFSVANNMSIDARYLHGAPITGANPKDQLTVGANFHF